MADVRTTIQDYSDAQGPDKDLARLKQDVAAALQVAPEEVELQAEGNRLVATAKGKAKAQIVFQDPKDELRLWAKMNGGAAVPMVDLGIETPKPDVRLGSLPQDSHETAFKAGPFKDLSDKEMVARFKEQMAAQLGLRAEEVRFGLKDGQVRLLPVRDSKWSLMVGRFFSPVVKEKGVDVHFVTREDYVRLVKVVAHSKSPVVSHLGQKPSSYSVTIPNYPGDLKRDEAIARFIDDLSRTLGAPPEQIEVHYVEGVMEAKVKGRDKVYDVLFKHGEDFERFSRWAVESRSPRLSDFGKKKVETYINGSMTTGYPDPAGKLKFNQSLTTQFYTGDSAQHHWTLGVDMNQNPFGDTPFVLDSALLGYHHHFWGDWMRASVPRAS